MRPALELVLVLDSVLRHFEADHLPRLAPDCEVAHELFVEVARPEVLPFCVTFAGIVDVTFDDWARIATEFQPLWLRVLDDIEVASADSCRLLRVKPLSLLTHLLGYRRSIRFRINYLVILQLSLTLNLHRANGLLVLWRLELLFYLETILCGLLHSPIFHQRPKLLLQPLHFYIFQTRAI